MSAKDVKRLERRTMRDIAIVLASVILGGALRELLDGVDAVSLLALVPGLLLLVVALRMKR